MNERPEQGNYQPTEDIDSGSAYEESSADEDILSHDERLKNPRRSTSARQKKRRRSTSTDEGAENFESESRSQTPYTQERIRQDAIEWAARFEGPKNGEVRNPTRRPAGSRSKKRQAKPASQIRAKRLKGFYSNEYRDLLNKEIYDATTGFPMEEHVSLERSQIGASVWTPEEKESFFSCLPRLGRDNVRGISNLIGTKSEIEVQEYIQLLHQGVVDKDDTRHQLLGETDFPAAVQISEECCSVIERAADALASRQERYEEEVARSKWGESWLLTPEVCHWIDKHRDEIGEEDALHNILPAADFLNLKNWLFLSERIFMNPGAPREEDNWQALAEEGENPAIRATAFTDFHSLAVSVTKRLVSTTLYCTMSKLRAMGSNKVKHAEVSRSDVEAAVKILGLKPNRNEFWIGCARRCNLGVFDDDNFSESDYMTYDEVEAVLSSKQKLQISRRRDAASLVAEAETDTDESEVPYLPDTEESDSDDEVRDGEQSEESAHNLTTDDEDDDISLDLSDSEFANLALRRSHILKKAKLRKANERAQENHTAAIDTEANNVEEQRLWSLLRQAPPFEIKSEIAELPERPKPNRSDMQDTVDWRQNMEYWSAWETMERPIPSEDFARVVKRKRTRSQRPRRSGAGVDKVAGSATEQDLVLTSDLEGDEDISDASLDEEERSEIGLNLEHEDGSHVSISSGRPSPQMEDAIPRSSVAPSIKSESDSDG